MYSAIQPRPAVHAAQYAEIAALQDKLSGVADFLKRLKPTDEQ